MTARIGDRDSMKNNRYSKIQIVTPFITAAGTVFIMLTVFTGIRAFLIPAALILLTSSVLYIIDSRRKK